MDRRTFLLSSTAFSLTAAAADAPMPMTTLGKTGMRISRITVGGYHMRTKGEDEGVRIIHRAIDLGVNMFDSAALYHDGASDITYGKALEGGLRQKIHLMTKAHKYTAADSMQQLETSLRSMRTDYLDLWCCHQVSTQAEVDQILAPGGSLETFVKAKQQGKVRHIGFTGHHDPAVHQRLLAAFEGWETVQHPVNLIDPHYLSFIKNVLPKVRARGMGLLAMKSNAIGGITGHGIASIDECLRFTWSQNIDTLVSGMTTVAELEHNVAACKAFQPMSAAEQTALLERTKAGVHGSKVESYKVEEGSAGCRVHRDGEAV